MAVSEAVRYRHIGTTESINHPVQARHSPPGTRHPAPHPAAVAGTDRAAGSPGRAGVTQSAGEVPTAPPLRAGAVRDNGQEGVGSS
ncbi:hypothetical protein GCM10012279_28420 [Micromonospora yangpuensis]|nr:hypothetical protein GCM10012279_28420 [Micromonospora yangpuensis]